VQAHAAIAGQGMEEFLEQFGIHLAHLVAGEIDLPDQVGALAEVKARTAERLVHRDIGVAKARDAGKIAQRLEDRLADDDACILDGMVHVDVQVALAAHSEVDGGMLGKAFQHVIEEADTGFDIGLARAIEIEGDRNIGFLRLAGDGGCAVFNHLEPYSALYSQQLARFVH